MKGKYEGFGGYINQAVEEVSYAPSIFDNPVSIYDYEYVYNDILSTLVDEEADILEKIEYLENNNKRSYYWKGKLKQNLIQQKHYRTLIKSFKLYLKHEELCNVIKKYFYLWDTTSKCGDKIYYLSHNIEDEISDLDAYHIRIAEKEYDIFKEVIKKCL